jgi:hypothetical protein
VTRFGRANCAAKGTWGIKFIGVCGGWRSREIGRKVMCVGCMHVVGDKSKAIGGRLGKEGKAWGLLVPR